MDRINELIVILIVLILMPLLLVYFAIADLIKQSATYLFKKFTKKN